MSPDTGHAPEAGHIPKKNCHHERHEKNEKGKTEKDKRTMRYRTIYLAILMLAVALVVLLAQCQVHALPPQAPPVRYYPAVSQAPPVRVTIRDCGCCGDPLKGICHCGGSCDCAPITQGARWYRDGWRLDNNGQWYRWVSVGETHRTEASPGHPIGTVSTSPTYYVSPTPVSAPVSLRSVSVQDVRFLQRSNGGGFRSGGNC